MKQKLQRLCLSTHVKIHTCAVVVGAVVTAIGSRISEFDHVHPVAWFGLLVIVFGLIWRIVFIKCPHCASKLYHVRSLPQYCPDCGEKLF